MFIAKKSVPAGTDLHKKIVKAERLAVKGWQMIDGLKEAAGKPVQHES